MTRLSNLTFLSIANNNFSGCVPVELSDLWVQEERSPERCEVEEKSPSKYLIPDPPLRVTIPQTNTNPHPTGGAP